MIDVNEIFWNASLNEIKEGFSFNEETETYTCLICGKCFVEGVIYKNNDIYIDAKKAIKSHIESEHISTFNYLLSMDKKLTGLTDLQKDLLNYFYNGYSDVEIVKEIDGGSASTIRNHRFSLKQKEKQAKIFLAIMELLDENKNTQKENFINIRKCAKMIDERYAITEEENGKYLKKYFPEGIDGPLLQFPLKEKRKLIVLMNIVKKFDSTKKYTEKEVNQILKSIYPDYVTIRRYLIEYGFMDRHNDGSSYWVKE